jgi:hypothetical protein
MRAARLSGVRGEQVKRMQLQARDSATEPEIATKASGMRLRMLDDPIGLCPGQAKLNGTRVSCEDAQWFMGHLSRRPAPSNHDGSQP